MVVIGVNDDLKQQQFDFTKTNKVQFLQNFCIVTISEPDPSLDKKDKKNKKKEKSA